MSWDKYYFDICEAVASNSKCFSRRLGAIVVLDKSIISTGYNGPPRGIPTCNERWTKDEILIQRRNEIKWINPAIDMDKTCPRYMLGYKSGGGIELCVAGHAERNALINAARHGIAVKGASLYLNTFIPCKECMIEIINAGILEVVCTELKYYDEITKYIVKESKIKIRKFEV